MGCASALHALHAAAVDPRLSSLVLINLPLFTVPTTNVLGQLEQRGRSASEYLGKLTRPGSWGNLLRGLESYSIAVSGPWALSPILLLFVVMSCLYLIFPGRDFST